MKIISWYFYFKILNEVFLDYINSILINGMAPSLFSNEEKDEIQNRIRNDSLEAGYNQTKFTEIIEFSK